MVALLAPIAQHHLGALGSALQRGAPIETIWLQIVIKDGERAVRYVLHLALAPGCTSSFQHCCPR